MVEYILTYKKMANQKSRSAQANIHSKKANFIELSVMEFKKGEALKYTPTDQLDKVEHRRR